MKLRQKRDLEQEQKREDQRISREIHRLFWRANWQAKWTLIAGIGLRIPALIAIQIAIPVAIAYALQAIIKGDYDAVNRYAWLILIYAIIHALCWGSAALIISKNGVEAGKYLQKQVFSNYLNKDYDFYSNAFFGSLGAQATRLRESMNNEYNVIVTLIMPKQIVVVGGGLVVIGYYSWQLAIISILSMAVILSWTIVTSRWRLLYRRKLGEASSNLSGQIADALTQATVVKSFATESYEDGRLNKPLNKWAHAQYTSWALGGPADMGRMFLTAVATVILLITTANLYRQGSIDIAMVALVQLYVIKLFSATVEIAEMIKLYESAMGASYQPVKTMLLSTDVNDPQSPVKIDKHDTAITLKDVSFAYDKKHALQAVKKVSIDIKAGEKIGIVGYSGSGKTTLTKLLMRFMDIDDGSIVIGGSDIRELRQSELRKHIAFVPQEPLLFHRSIKENIAYGDPKASNSSVINATKLAYVDEFVDELPDGYDTMVGERGVKLSGGQRQRVAIARAILKDAPILILDEATSALDSRSEQLIQKALWKLMKNRTAVVIAHRLSTIQRMDKIAVMDKGAIVQYGTHQDLLADKQGIYATLWSHQSGGYLIEE
jgi:ATP-binding cassette, subfamily B, bacterial